MELDFKPAVGHERRAAGWQQVQHTGKTQTYIEARIPSDPAEPVEVALVRYTQRGGEREPAGPYLPEVLEQGTFETCVIQIDILVELLATARKVEWYRAVPA